MHARREAGMHNPAMPSNGLRCPLYSTHPHGETPLSSASSIDRQTIHGFNDVQALAGPDMAAVNALIRSRLASDVVLINQISEHIIGSGRPGTVTNRLLEAFRVRARGLVAASKR